MIESSSINNQGFFKIILEPADEGVYIFVYETNDSQHPERDYLEDNIKLAKQLCELDFGTPSDSWKTDSTVKALMK